ncbi:Tyrosine kinase-like (TKL) protein [Toxoplasma gondii VAND]|uniref:Tyrosine kinase-like (TKL) protein n=1 Tax=Toxoplasma gondii VAND TaxID=933077 RepID=A0A086Q4T4_TOXGO|nr:Tyrosine kinase-like (TKL) protein [Toxoplasma gondii VAND]
MEYTDDTGEHGIALVLGKTPSEPLDLSFSPTDMDALKIMSFEDATAFVEHSALKPEYGTPGSSVGPKQAVASYPEGTRIISFSGKSVTLSSQSSECKAFLGSTRIPQTRTTDVSRPHKSDADRLPPARCNPDRAVLASGGIFVDTPYEPRGEKAPLLQRSSHHASRKSAGSSSSSQDSKADPRGQRDQPIGGCSAADDSCRESSRQVSSDSSIPASMWIAKDLFSPPLGCFARPLSHADSPHFQVDADREESRLDLSTRSRRETHAVSRFLGLSCMSAEADVDASEIRMSTRDRLSSLPAYPEARLVSDSGEGRLLSVHGCSVVSAPQTLSNCRVVSDVGSSLRRASPSRRTEDLTALRDSGERQVSEPPARVCGEDAVKKMCEPDSPQTDQSNSVTRVSSERTQSLENFRKPLVEHALSPVLEQKVDSAPTLSEGHQRFPPVAGGSQPNGVAGPAWQQRRRVSKKKVRVNQSVDGISPPRLEASTEKNRNNSSDQKDERNAQSPGLVSGQGPASPWVLRPCPPCEVTLAEVSMNGLIGKGATSSVYRATWRDGEVACKIVAFPVGGSPASRAPQIRQLIHDFRKELVVISRLNHPNLVGLRGAGTRNPPLFMLTELCAGGSLFDLLHKGSNKRVTGEQASSASRAQASESAQVETRQDPSDDPYRAAVASMLEKRLGAETRLDGSNAESVSEESGGFWSFLGKFSFFPKKEPRVPTPASFFLPPKTPSNEDILFSRGPAVSLDWKLRAQIALDLARGCQYLHSVNVVHRDIKSLNVLLTNDCSEGLKSGTKPIAKLADFGCAVLADGGPGSSTGAPGQSAGAAGWAGTVLWMAPEALAKQSCTEKADVYSFAIVLYELLSNRIPFEELQGTPAYKKLPELIPCGLRPNISPHALPRDLPEGLRDLMESCWRQEPANRPPFTHIVKALEIIIDGL